MITINHTHGKISIKGHAGYAPHGQDIVCAAISALTETFVMSVDELTTDKLNCIMGAGNALIKYRNLTEQSQLLLSSFLLGCEAIAAAYPDNVQVIK